MAKHSKKVKSKINNKISNINRVYEQTDKNIA